MLRTPLDILDLFVGFPGDLLFFLLVIAFSLGSLFLAIGHRARFPHEHSTRRYLFSAAALVAVWLVMLGASALAQTAALDANRFMPPLERLAYAVTLSLLGWAILSAEFERWRNRSNLFIVAVTFALALLYLSTSANWLAESAGGSAFNATAYALVWAGVSALIAIVCGILTLVNIGGIVDAPLKTLFFLVVALGNGLDLIRLSQGDAAGSYLGGARLAYAAGLALFPLIVYRYAVALLENSLVEVVLAASQPSSALSQTPADAVAPAEDGLSAAASSWNFAAAPVAGDSQKLLNAVGMMLEGREISQAPAQIVRSALESLGADVCFLIQVQENKYADITAGYDRVADRGLAGISLNLNEQPTLLESARRGEQTILFAEYHAEELTDLFRRLNISPLSNTYVQPLGRTGESQAVLLVLSPYRQVDLSLQEIEALREIGVVAGHVLAWTAAMAEANSRKGEARINFIAEKTSETAADGAALRSNRLELESSLTPIVERSRNLRSQIADLRQQLQQQQVRMLEGLVEASGDRGAARRLNASFDEQARLRDLCELTAHDLLDAETVLRVLNVGSGETLAQIIREFLHKETNVLESERDRLRRQINSALVMGKSAAADGITAVLQSIADETAQLELERDQQRRRLESIAAKLETLGTSGSYSHLTRVMIQLYAEREAFGKQLDELNQDRQTLIDDRQQARAADGGDREEIERQLKHLSADHEQLLNAREEMRRERQQLQDELRMAEAEKSELVAQNMKLQGELSANVEGRETTQQRIKELIGERDNLLKLRDQLTARVAAAMAGGGAVERSELDELRATVAHLSEQREELALELSDARTELEAARDSQPDRSADEVGETSSRVSWEGEVLSSVAADLQSPLRSLSDYTDLLLAESLGILGTAQLHVLRLMAEDLGKLSALITRLREASEFESAGSAQPLRDVDIVSVVDEVVRASADMLGDKQLQIELALDDNLPPVSADEVSLKQILTRLLANAGAVSPPGSNIKISAKAGLLGVADEGAAAERIEISVHDCGGGIAEADLPRVFERKYRNAYPSIAGLSDTGVGMSIARAYLRANDGDLRVTSHLNSGSVFHVALPLQLVASIEE